MILTYIAFVDVDIYLAHMHDYVGSIFWIGLNRVIRILCQHHTLGFQY